MQQSTPGSYTRSSDEASGSDQSFHEISSSGSGDEQDYPQESRQFRHQAHTSQQHDLSLPRLQPPLPSLQRPQAVQHARRPRAEYYYPGPTVQHPQGYQGPYVPPYYPEYQPPTQQDPYSDYQQGYYPAQAPQYQYIVQYPSSQEYQQSSDLGMSPQLEHSGLYAPSSSQMFPPGPAQSGAAVSGAPFVKAPTEQMRIVEQFPSLQGIINLPSGGPGQQPLTERAARTTTMSWDEESTLCIVVETQTSSITRRCDNNMINGTKLLNVAGMTRGRRDGILKGERVRHVVKIGNMHLKGVWIPFERALDIARREGLVDKLYPLFVANISKLLYDPSNLTRTRQVVRAAQRRNPRFAEWMNGIPTRLQPHNIEGPAPSSSVARAQAAEPHRRHHYVPVAPPYYAMPQKSQPITVGQSSYRHQQHTRAPSASSAYARSHSRGQSRMHSRAHSLTQAPRGVQSIQQPVSHQHSSASSGSHHQVSQQLPQPSMTTQAQDRREPIPLQFHFPPSPIHLSQPSQSQSGQEVQSSTTSMGQLQNPPAEHAKDERHDFMDFPE